MEEFDEYFPEFEMGYKEGMERARAGGQVMGTEIEGHGRLARLNRRIQQQDTENRAERNFLSSFYELRQHFDPSDEVFLKDKFLALPNADYKNSVAFLLAQLVLRRGLSRVHLKQTKHLADGIDRADITEEDILRYSRLIQMVDEN